MSHENAQITVGFWTIPRSTFLCTESSCHRLVPEVDVRHTRFGFLERGEEQIVAAGNVVREAPVPLARSVRILRKAERDGGLLIAELL